MSATRFTPGGPLTGSLTPPPDKSISHRAALLAAMADGPSELAGYLDSADTRSTLRAVEALGGGVEIAEEDDRSLTVRVAGIGLDGPGRSGPRDVAVDVGNAGTLLRLLPGWLAGQPGGSWVLDGDESIRRRPVDRVTTPLSRMGADVSGREDRLPPLRVRGSSLRGIEYPLPVASAQVKSCILLAGLMADGETAVLEGAPTRDHTERMLSAAGVRVETTGLGPGLAAGGAAGGKRIALRRTERLEPCGFSVPGDFSSASFFVVAALLTPGSRIRLEGVGINPTRIGLLGILNRMGARIEVEESPALGGEPRGTIDARHGPLRATSVRPEEVPLAIDELPLVALAGAFAEGTTRVSGAHELRHKESDRIATVVDAIRGMGGEAEATDDGFRIQGAGDLRGGRVDSHGDHRLAMLGAIAGLASRDGVEVEGMDAATVSYPSFEADLRRLAT